MHWTSLIPDLLAATTLGQQASGGMYCTPCQEIDNVIGQCALGYMQQPLTSQLVSMHNHHLSPLLHQTGMVHQFAPHGTRVAASTLAPAALNTSAHRASSVIRPKIVLKRHQTQQGGKATGNLQCSNPLVLG